MFSVDILLINTGIKISMKLGRPKLQSTCVLDQIRERIRSLHYSLSTEKNYLYWLRFFIRWHGRAGKMLHPVEMGAAQVEAFLTILAMERKAPASTDNQVFSALRFLYHLVLAVDLSRIGNAKISPVGAGDTGRPKGRKCPAEGTPLSYSLRLPQIPH